MGIFLHTWYRVHAGTLVFLLVIGAALVFCQVQPHNVGGGGVSSRTLFQSYQRLGWPISCLHHFETGLADYSPAKKNWSGLTKTNTDWQWDVDAVGLDLTASLLLLGSTIFVCERWRRRSGTSWRFGLQSLLLLIAIVAVVICFYINEITIPWNWPNLVDNQHRLIHCGLDVTPWFVAVPMLLGIGFSVYSLGWVVCRGALVVVKLAGGRITNNWRKASCL